MNSASLNLYQAQHSPIHHLDPRIKVILTVLIIVSNVLLPDGAWLALGTTWALLLLAVQLAKISYLFLFSRALIVLPFAFAAVTTLFSTPGSPVFTLPWPAVPVTDAGLIRFGTIMLRSWISVQAAILLTASTPFPDLIHALRHLKIPTILVSIISFMYRYLFVLIDEARRLIRARASRSAALPGQKPNSSIRQNARTAGSMVGQLFLRSVERSERIYQAMQVRGYRGHLLTLNPHKIRTSDWLVLVVVVILIISLQLLMLYSI